MQRIYKITAIGIAAAAAIAVAAAKAMAEENRSFVLYNEKSFVCGISNIPQTDNSCFSEQKGKEII